MEEENIKVQDIINALKDRWQLIVCITLIATIFSACFSFFIIKPKYSASTKLFIGKESDDKNSNYSNNDVQMYQKLLKTYADVITTRDLVEDAFNKDNIEINPDEALNKLTVTPKTDTQILQISYTSGDKQECKDVVDSVTNKFIEMSSELISNSNVRVIEKATLPKSPVSPNKKLNIAAAFLLGLMIGAGLAILLEFLDNTFKDKEQIEKILDLPVLGSIPNSEKVM